MQVLKSEYRIDLETRAKALEAAVSGFGAEGALRRCLEALYPGQVCMVSSFGTESAVLLHLAAQIAPDIPVLFIDTGKLFDQTLTYRDQLAGRLGLTNVQVLRPAAGDVAACDADGALHQRDPDMCCHVRKTLPLIRALGPYKVWVAGRKRYHGSDRTQTGLVEIQDGKLKLNPLWDWDAADLRAYAKRWDLPDHPLLAQSYPSVGCAPCTSPVTDAKAGARSGRWAGSKKTECGIHFGADGRAARGRLSS